MQLDQRRHQEKPVRKDTSRAAVQRRAKNAEPRQTIDDFMVSLDASPVQLDAFDAALSDTHGAIRGAAKRGTAGPSHALPHQEKIQAAFGPEHDLSGVEAHTGPSAAAACDDMNANGYASGNHVVFGQSPSLELAAHEATHVVQQQAGVRLSSGVGTSGDVYEQQADAVAQRVAAGQSAADLLPASKGASGSGVQRDEKPEAKKTDIADDQKALIDKMTLQEVDDLIGKIEKKKDEKKDDPVLGAALDYAKAHRKKVNAEVHAGNGASSEEQKKHLKAYGSATSSAGSIETGKNDSTRAANNLGRDGDSTKVERLSVDNKTATTTVTQSTNAAGEQSKVVEQTQNDKESKKASQKTETETASRKDGVTTREETVKESNSKGTNKETSTRTVSNDKETSTTTSKKETSSLDEQKKDKEKKDKEDREKRLMEGNKALEAQVLELEAKAAQRLREAKSPEDKKAIEKELAAARDKLLQKASAAKSVTLLNVEKAVTAGDDHKGKTGSKDIGIGKVSAEGEVATAEAKVGAQVAWDPTKGVSVTGSAQAKATLVGGSAKFEMPSVPFNIAGQELTAVFGITVSASVLAEAQGAIAVNLAKNAAKVGIELAQGPTTAGAGVGAKASVFAGAKAGVEMAAKVDWQKKSSYRAEVAEMLKKYLPEFAVNKLPIEKLADRLFGSGGKVTVIGLKAGLDATAGAGAEIAGGLSFAGGVLKVDGKFQGTVGLGVGTSIKAEIDAIEGMRLLGIVLAQAPEFASEAGIAAEKVWAWVKEQAKSLYNKIKGGE